MILDRTAVAAAEEEDIRPRVIRRMVEVAAAPIPRAIQVVVVVRRIVIEVRIGHTAVTTTDATTTAIVITADATAIIAAHRMVEAAAAVDAARDRARAHDLDLDHSKCGVSCSTTCSRADSSLFCVCVCQRQMLSPALAIATQEINAPFDGHHRYSPMRCVTFCPFAAAVLLIYKLFGRAYPVFLLLHVHPPTATRTQPNAGGVFRGRNMIFQRNKQCNNEKRAAE